MTRVLRRLAQYWAGGNVDLEFGTLLRDSNRIIVLSDSHRKKLAERFPNVCEKSVLIPPPPFLRLSPETSDHRQRIRDQFQIGKDDFLLCFFGYFYPGKGLETLFEAVHNAAKKKPQLRLLLIGGFPVPWSPQVSAYPDMLKQKAIELGIEDRLAWTGNFPWDSDFGSSCLRAADLCVLPFDSGVYLNNSSFASAASHALPILSTRAEFVEPAFVHEHNVYLCSPKDPVEMAAALERLVDDAELRRRLSEGSQRMAQEWFSWERAIERTLATLTTELDHEVTPDKENHVRRRQM
jgi:glycosyltransferase involved in cell wall biosynthesis